MASPNYIKNNAEYLAEGAYSALTERDQSSYLTLEALPTIEAGLFLFNASASYVFTRAQFTQIRTAIYKQNCAMDLFYNRIWVTSLLEFNLITELATLEINIWNAHIGLSKSITGFVDPGDQGIEIETISPPVVLSQNEDINYTVTVSVTGPAEQNTTYQFTVGGLIFETQVTGSRLILFDFDLNWSQPEKILYEYFAAVYKAPKGHEYRRNMVNKVFRKSVLSYTFDGLEAQRYLNIVRYSRARFILVPIYQEGFLSKNELTGSLSVESLASIQYFWNLNNYAEYILIVDHEAKKVEAKSVVSIVGNVINISKVVLNTFNKNTAVIYPAYVAMVNDYSYRNITNKVIESKIAFQEVKPNAL